ncbi:hypothetical protein OA92_17105 [Marinomonas sp. SBI22]|uniref:hypothetical protein n=1 Tax=unclassified Marinomonas TaxID=196814 RepID=UPI0007AF3134|nr:MULTISPECIES: hypothetical protein [unclassified Marinomonas]KZM40265.1 hypothetical protein OA92_17105 [Marinomonas sp. SBI22]KZM41682.1 hypothetical protein OA91_16340 [Marinomonas sp. SBI8L]
MFGHHFKLLPIMSQQKLTRYELEENFKSVFFAGNSLMLASLIVVLATVFIGYLKPEDFSIATQVVSHIALVVFAAFLKVGYVMRLIGQNGIKAEIL